jgi:hypothetical protein
VRQCPLPLRLSLQHEAGDEGADGHQHDQQVGEA